MEKNKTSTALVYVGSKKGENKMDEIEDIKRELREAGIDPDELVRKARELLERLRGGTRPA